MRGNDSDRDFRDDDLRARFAELRRGEEAQAPEFEFPSPGWAGHGRWRSGGKLIALAVCLVAVTAAVLWLRLVLSKPERNGNPVVSITEWRPPTDFLLETPGRELLRTVPAIGVWHDHAKGSTRRQTHPQVRKQDLP